MRQLLFLKDGTLFAKEFNRVVHGERGDYIEFEKSHIKPFLYKKFDNSLNEEDLIKLGYYYMWMYPPENEDTKVYYQLQRVKYADYIPGKYYVSPDMFERFKDPKKLF